MKKIYTYDVYQALKALNESIDEFIDQVNPEDATQIQDLVNSQEEIFQKYDLDQTEIDNIKNSVEDSIKVKLGISGDNI
jgi:divalent metal cation (Fe/Co/Zn/Cd) transporter